MKRNCRLIISRGLLTGFILANFLLSPASALDKGKKKKEAWVPLFDGKTLGGWQTLRGKPIRGWTAEKGVLHKQEKGGGDLYTKKDYADFVLELEWKIAKRGNSGVKYRMQWYGKSYLGPEYQMHDNTWMKKTDRKTKGNASGSLYDLLAVDAANWSVKPLAEWNHTRIVAKGSHVEHWLNGKKVIHVDLKSERFKKAHAQSKFRKLPNFAQNKAGKIMLQDHGCEMWFRKIRIKEIKKPKDDKETKPSGQKQRP